MSHHALLNDAGGTALRLSHPTRFPHLENPPADAQSFFQYSRVFAVAGHDELADDRVAVDAAENA